MNWFTHWKLLSRECFARAAATEVGAARDRQRGRVWQVLVGPHDRGLRARDMGHARDTPRAAESARDDARQGLMRVLIAALLSVVLDPPRPTIIGALRT